MKKDDTRMVEIKYKNTSFIVDKNILLECVRCILSDNDVVFEDYESMIALLKKTYLYNKEFFENITGYILR